MKLHLYVKLKSFIDQEKDWENVYTRVIDVKILKLKITYT